MVLIFTYTIKGMKVISKKNNNSIIKTNLAAPKREANTDRK
jgi:hypothetical protein